MPNKLETVIQCAIRGGWKFKGYLPIDAKKTTNTGIQIIWNDNTLSGKDYNIVEPEVIICDPLFFKALGVSKGWGNQEQDFTEQYKEPIPMWFIYGKGFHEINLSHDLDQAIDYLYQLVTNNK